MSSTGFFNDLVIETIDHLMSTPEVTEEIELIALTKSYQFDDKDLEDLSGSQKVLVRMGVPNARKVKARLSQLRNILILGQ